MFMLRSNSVVSMWFIRQGQFQNKYGTIRRFLFQIQLSTMEASQFLGNRKAKAGMVFAAPGRVRSVKAIEYTTPQLPWNAGAVIFDQNENAVSGSAG